MKISIPDGDYDQEVGVVVDGREITHVMVVTYRGGKPIAIRNPWGNDPATPCPSELAERLMGLAQAHAQEVVPLRSKESAG
jgi:hypothetical protein